MELAARRSDNVLAVTVPRDIIDRVVSATDISDRERTSLLGAILQVLAGDRPTVSRNSKSKYRQLLQQLGLLERDELAVMRAWSRA